MASRQIQAYSAITQGMIFIAEDGYKFSAYIFGGQSYIANYSQYCCTVPVCADYYYLNSISGSGFTNYPYGRLYLLASSSWTTAIYYTAQSNLTSNCATVTVVNEHGTHAGLQGTNHIPPQSAFGVMIETDSVEEGYTFKGWKITDETASRISVNQTLAASANQYIICSDGADQSGSGLSEVTFSGGYEYAVLGIVPSSSTYSKDTITITAIYEKTPEPEPPGPTPTPSGGSGSGLIAFQNNTLCFVSSGALACT